VRRPCGVKRAESWLAGAARTLSIMSGTAEGGLPRTGIGRHFGRIPSAVSLQVSFVHVHGSTPGPSSMVRPQMDNCEHVAVPNGPSLESECIPATTTAKPKYSCPVAYPKGAAALGSLTATHRRDQGRCARKSSWVLEARVACVSIRPSNAARMRCYDCAALSQCQRVLPRLAGAGATPHKRANGGFGAHPVGGSGLSPMVVNSCPVTSTTQRQARPD
jgi:hypothetical protein